MPRRLNSERTFVTKQVAAAIFAVASGGCATPTEPYPGPVRHYEVQIEHLEISGFREADFTDRDIDNVVRPFHIREVRAPEAGLDTFRLEDVRPPGQTHSYLVERFLTDTGCIERVDDFPSKGDLRLVGEARGRDGGFTSSNAASSSFLSVFTLTFLFGVPWPAYSTGYAKAELYSADTRIATFFTTARVERNNNPFWGETWIRSAFVAKAIALRKLADQVASTLCGSSGPAGGDDK
jgi:hypothetical protein